MIVVNVKEKAQNQIQVKGAEISASFDIPARYLQVAGRPPGCTMKNGKTLKKVHCSVFFIDLDCENCCCFVTAEIRCLNRYGV